MKDPLSPHHSLRSRRAPETGPTSSQEEGPR